MPYRRGYGRGFGFRGYAPPWPYIGWGRGGLPRCWAFDYYWGPPPCYEPAWEPPYCYWQPPVSKEEELNFLRDEMASLKEELEAVESRIKELQAEKEK
ncbi:MAG: DUF5320 domain-containing protein [Thermodesulfobacteriota bacterium]